MALSLEELRLLQAHANDLASKRMDDIKHERYYDGEQRVEQLGMAIPPAMRKFLVIANWSATVVDTIKDRQQVRSMALLGDETADPVLQRVWDSSNMDSHVDMFNVDRMVYGRAFLSVGADEDDPESALIRVESPHEISAFVDVRREVVTSAARFYGVSDIGDGPTHATLYLPDVTAWLAKSEVTGRWAEVDRDEHRLGAVPIVMHLNRRRSGKFSGRSEMSKVMGISDAAARSLTNMQFAQEAHGIPRMWMTGVARGDFLDDNGKPVPQFEAYFDAIQTLSDKDAKVGQLTAADLKNFETAMRIYGQQATVATGFPYRYWGLSTANPPAEGALIADESSLVRSVEAQNTQVGTTLGWAGALAYRIATGDWVTGNRVRVDWFDPSTPTVAQREDALMKRRSQGVLSREGYWDELGWSESRKERERNYLKAEAAEAYADPVMERILREVNNAGTESDI